jgi:hypothetical protein
VFGPSPKQVGRRAVKEIMEEMEGKEERGGLGEEQMEMEAEKRK